MGKFLERTVSLWSNPEAAYLAQNSVKTRNEFFAEMCGLTDKGHKLDLIKARVLKEYSDSPKEADAVQQLLDAVARNFYRFNNDPISNLTEFVKKLIAVTDEQPTVDITSGLDPYRRKHVERVSYSFMMERFSFLGDLVLLDKDSLPVVYQVAEYEDYSNIFVYKGAKSLEVLQQTGLPSEFLTKTYLYLEHLKATSGIPIPSIVVGRPNFRKHGDSVSIVLGQDNLGCQLHETTDFQGNRVLVCKNTERSLSAAVFCLS